MSLDLDEIRGCMEDFVPSIIATCDDDGVPNAALISQVHYVDRDRVALSYQFFNKTRRNLIATGVAAVRLIHPTTCERYLLDLDYIETQTFGPVFEAMKARLAGIASHSGMQGVFQLLGSDIFRVRGITRLDGPTMAGSAPRPILPAVLRICHRLAATRDLSALFDAAMACLADEFDIAHALILMQDEVEPRLFTVASLGYAESGIGSEIGLGEGVIGVAAREGVPIRISCLSSEYSYGHAVRRAAEDSGFAVLTAREIPYPGLEAPQSQLALPIRCQDRTLGVLFVESPEVLRFRHEDEDALSLVAEHIGLLIGLRQRAASMDPDPDFAISGDTDRVVTVRHYSVDSSIFLDHEYLIKGVAGAILWKLLSEHVKTGRVDFTNRELRLDPALRLPQHAENLEARLILLMRRLAERSDSLRLVRAGRGRLRLERRARIVLDDGEAANKVPAA